MLDQFAQNYHLFATDSTLIAVPLGVLFVGGVITWVIQLFN